MIAVIAFVSSVTIHAIAPDRALTATPPSAVLSDSSSDSPAASGICLNPATTAADLSRLGMEKYQSGQFGDARDCWRQARKQHQGTAEIADQINQAQAEQALGLYPLACKTLLPLYSPTILDCKALPQADSAKDNRARVQFLEQVKANANTPDKIAGLHSLGNILRGVGSLRTVSDRVVVSPDPGESRSTVRFG